MPTCHVAFSGMDLLSLFRAQDTKAIPAHPALMAGEPPLTVREAEQPRARRTPFAQRNAKRHTNAYGGSTDAIDWIMDCVRLIAETASSAPWHFEDSGERLVNRRRPSTPDNMREAPEEIVKLFEKPNPYMDWHQFIELTLIDYLLVGNAYWFKWKANDEDQPIALYRCSPSDIKVVPGVFGPEAYELQLEGQKDPLKIPAEAMVHFRQANPHSRYYGLGVVQGGARPLDMELALTDTQATYFERHARPSMVVQTDRRVPDQVFKRLKRELRQFYGSSRNAGEMMVLEAGLKATQVSPSAREADFKILSDMSRDRIAAMFRVPLPLLGILDAATGTRLSDAQRVFDTKTMRPLLDKFQQAITSGLASAWDLEFLIDYDYVMPPEDKMKLVQTLSSVPGIKVKEIREFAGYEPLGDERDEWVLNMPGEEGVEEDTDRGHPDRNLAGEPGRPPNGENAPTFPGPGSSLPRTSKVSTPPPSKKSIEDRLSDLDTKAVVLEREGRTGTEKRIEPPKDTWKDIREGEIDEVVADLQHNLRNASHSLERSLLDALEGKAMSDRIVSRIKKSEAWRSFTATMAGALEAAVQRAVGAAVIHSAQDGIEPEDEIDYDFIARQIVYRPEGVRAMSDTLKQEVVQKVEAALEHGDSRADLERAVREALDFWRQTKAETIALTDATEGYNEGRITAAELAGFTRFHVHDGEDHDDECREANGSIWDANTARENRTQHPRCRRSFTPVGAVA